MKKRKFYSEKKRGAQWTEEPKGHKIDFAEKYIGEESYSDKYDEKRSAYQVSKKNKRREKINKRLRVLLSIALSIVLVCTGYTIMDAYMIRHDKPLASIGVGNEENDVSIADLSLDIAAMKVESVSLDSSVMLSSVTNELTANGFTSLVFDAKRSDGTIGYASTLASIDTFSAISNASSHPQASIKQLISNDILPIARICCYQDNVVPVSDATAALKVNGKLYKDENGNTYLNPNSESAYSYIRDIITELNGYGVEIFILYGCDLPEEISVNYDDGFELISKRLNADFNSSIKLLNEVDVKISGKDPETGKVTNSALKKEITSLDKLSNNQIMLVSTKANSKKVSTQLIRNDYNCFVIEE